MSSNNRVSPTLSSQDSADIVSALEGVRSKLPFLVTLSPRERQQRAKMGHKSVGFDEKCVAYMQSNPEFLPGFVGNERMAGNRAVRAELLRFAAPLNALAQAVNDTLLELSSDIWTADLAYYRVVQAAARRDEPAAKLILADLKTRFSRTPVAVPAPAAAKPEGTKTMQ